MWFLGLIIGGFIGAVGGGAGAVIGALAGAGVGWGRTSRAVAMNGWRGSKHRFDICKNASEH
jgi:hypothetical protein